MKNVKNNFYNKINIIKDPLLINPSLDKDLSQNKTISISKISTPKNVSQKVDSKCQTSSNFLNYKINTRINYYNNENNLNKLNYIKSLFTNDIDINSNRNHNLLVNTIQLDINYLRLISTRYIQNKNKNLSIFHNDKNRTGVFNNQYINNKKTRTDIVKYRFLQSQKNYIKRIANLKENSFIQKNIINFKKYLKEYKNSYSLKNFNNLLLKNKDINQNKNKSKAENNSFPSILNSLHKTNNGKINKKIHLSISNLKIEILKMLL